MTTKKKKKNCEGNYHTCGHPPDKKLMQNLLPTRTQISYLLSTVSSHTQATHPIFRQSMIH